MIVAAHQPPYLAWLGLLEKIALADKFVAMDNVQYQARGFLHRTLYSTKTEAKYLSLSVSSSGHQTSGLVIGNIDLSAATISARHFETLRHRYSRTPGWRVLAPSLGDIMNRQWNKLIDLNLELLHLTMKTFHVSTPIILGSALDATGSKQDLIIHMVKSIGGSGYLSGKGARAYMDETRCNKDNIQLYWQDFHHPQYFQSHLGNFQPGCFALEWFLEEPDRAVDDFWAMVAASARRAGLSKRLCGQ